jgi:chromosome segregation ATPase
VDELNALSARNDDLIAARERDAQAMNDMEAQVAEYKRKYDSVRIELRNLKGVISGRERVEFVHQRMDFGLKFGDSLIGLLISVEKCRQLLESGRQAQEEINQWRDRCDNLEDEVRRLEVEKTALERIPC